VWAHQMKVMTLTRFVTLVNFMLGKFLINLKAYCVGYA
jgi:hypothetical protein